jgi:signal transduction histidine kinase
MEALGMLAGGVAHDLNNALGILVGYSELLAEDLDEKSPLRAHVDYIRQGGQRASAIVQDLLTLARRGVQTSEIVDLNSVIDEFQDSPEFEKICSFHPDVRVENLLSAGLLNIKGSPVHLRKTVMNLVSNAAEAMPSGGTVTIETRNLYLDRPVPGYDVIQEGDYVVLSVSDTGEGIAGKDLT